MSTIKHNFPWLFIYRFTYIGAPGWRVMQSLSEPIQISRDRIQSRFRQASSMVSHTGLYAIPAPKSGTWILLSGLFPIFFFPICSFFFLSYSFLFFFFYSVIHSLSFFYIFFFLFFLFDNFLLSFFFFLFFFFFFFFFFWSLFLFYLFLLLL